ncbi:MAG: thiamine pyrophosphate-dependent enzyme, partial [Pseudomonadota bacterium]|nr:thiamine pyrophosphate-dependent enzyme [Pseudomonadota bacterium]
IDADPAEIGRNFPGVTGICGDPGLVLRDLVELLQSDRGRDWIEHTHALRRQWLEEVEPRSVSEARPTTVERLCREIERALPEDALLVADTGYSGIWTGTHIKLNGCGQDYLRAAGSLGWGFPAAIGAQCALPGRPVVCFCGDGGFYYHLSELETARRWNLPVTVIVNNNASFGQDIPGVREVYGAENGRAEDLTHFEPVDFSEVAKAFGCQGIRVEEPGSLADAITNGIASNQPTVIDVVTDPEPRAPDAWFPPPSQ